MAAKPTSRVTTAAMNEALLLGSLRQHELIEAAGTLNVRLEAEITARQQTARELAEKACMLAETARELAEKARLLDLTQDAIIVRGLDGRVSYWNHGAETLYGWSSEEALGKFSHRLFKTVFFQPLKEITAELQRTGHWTGEMIHTRRDGQRMTVLVRKVLDRDCDGNPASVLQTITDITARKRADKILREAEAQLADRAVHLEKLVTKRTKELTVAHAQLVAEAETRKRMEAEIAGAIEGERERLGQELHDGLVQELTGIVMMLHVLVQTLKQSDPASAKEANRLRIMLDTVHGNARDLAKNFYPVELQHHGLQVALEGIAERTRHQYRVKCVVQAGPRVGTCVRDLTSVQLFRIAQEAVQNAAKHAQAKKIVIQLVKEKGLWLLTVRDDGVGLPDGVLESEGMGLRIMRYRAGIIQGTLSVDNAEGGGVLVCCRAPIGGLQ